MHTTNSNNAVVNPLDFKEALELLEEAQKQKKFTRKELPFMVATLAKGCNVEAMLTKFVPDGKILIGANDEEIKEMENNPKPTAINKNFQR